MAKIIEAAPVGLMRIFARFSLNLDRPNLRPGESACGNGGRWNGYEVSTRGL
jgi:hypothetical protein